MALLSPTVGRKAQHWGRRPLLLIGFAALAIRGVLFATVQRSLSAGRGAGVRRHHGGGVRVMIPLIVADVAFGSGHFNLAQGIVGTATGIGASLEHGLGRLCQRQVRQATAFLGLVRRRRDRAFADPLCDAGNPAHRHDRAEKNGRLNEFSRPNWVGKTEIRRRDCAGAGGCAARSGGRRKIPKCPGREAGDSARDTVSSVRPR